MSFSESETHPEQEEVSERLYGIAVIHGGGFREDKEGSLTMESKMRALAAGALAEGGAVSSLIFSGGHTQEGQTSEARALYQYMLEKYPNLKDFPAEFEEGSFDTNENAALTAKRLEALGEKSVLIVTNDFHLKRAREKFESLGINTDTISAEELVTERSEAHQALMERYLKSLRVKKKKAVELILRGIAKVDPDGKFITALARKTRGG